MVVWSPFPQTTDMMAPSTREFMINFGVDDLDLFLKKVSAKGVAIMERQDSDDGKFCLDNRPGRDEDPVLATQAQVTGRIE